MQRYQTLFRVCLTLSLIVGAAAVFVFFYFKIYDIILEMSGIRRKRDIRALQQNQGQANENFVMKRRKAKSTDTQPLVQEETVILQENLSGEETMVLEPQNIFTVEKELKLTEIRQKP